jgi:hypothetical protein
MARAHLASARALPRTILATFPGHSARLNAPTPAAGDTQIPSLEVIVAWGDCVIGVVQHTPPRRITLGEANLDGTPCDFLIPRQRLGFDCLPLVEVDTGVVEVTLPASAQGYLDDGRGARTGLERLRAEGRPMPQVDGARCHTLLHGEELVLTLGLFSVRIRACDVVARPKRALFGAEDRGVFGSFAATFLTAGVLVASMANLVPDMNGLSEDEINQEDVRLIQQYLMASALREVAVEETTNAEPSGKGERGGQSGHRSPGDEGKLGSTVSKRTAGRLAIQGPKDNPEPHLGRTELVEEAKHFGMTALLGIMNAAPNQGMSSPWGMNTALGRDDVDVVGHLFGDTINDAAGSGGLGLSGTGQGGGCVGIGCGAGIGIDHVGTIGGGQGFCDSTKGPCDGMGQGLSNGHGGLGSHRARVPRIRVANMVLSGRLPPEVIQRIVRQNYGRFRFCYEQGLAKNPNLEGRVVVRFVIGRDGAVSSAQGGGSDLPDTGVNSCIIQAFYGLSFPAPEGGLVTVSYPIALSSG